MLAEEHGHRIANLFQTKLVDDGTKSMMEKGKIRLIASKGCLSIFISVALQSLVMLFTSVVIVQNKIQQCVVYDIAMRLLSISKTYLRSHSMAMTYELAINFFQTTL